MAVYDSDKKRILTRILKSMILLFCIFLFYILFASSSTPIKDVKSAVLKSSLLVDIHIDVISVKGIPVAVYKVDKSWHFINAVNKYSGCVIKIVNNKEWLDVCSKQRFELNGQAKGNYKSLIKIRSKKIERGMRLYFKN